MTSSEVLTFAGALLVMVITPGPGVLACVSRSLVSGFRMAAFVTLGIITGDLIFVLTALFGLAAIAEVMGSFFVIVKYAGAIYLIWSGYRTWTSVHNLGPTDFYRKSTRLSSYFGGLCITLGNPKAIVFYLSILPAFIDVNRLTASDVLITLAVVLSILATVLLGYSIGASRARVVFRGWRVLRSVNRCSGGAMMVAGVLIMTND